MKQRNSNHFACATRMAGRVVVARLDVGREGDSYQINKMEWNKNNANAINAVSIGRFSLLFCCCCLGRVGRGRRRGFEDG